MSKASDNKGRTQVQRGWLRSALERLAFMCAAAASGALQAAEGMIPQGSETFKLSVGGMLQRFDSDLRLDGSQESSEFDLESISGLERNKGTFWGEATWRFASRHRLGLQVFTARRQNTRAISESIVIGDQDIPVNTVLSTETKSTFFVANYQYSFIKNENMELSGLLGLYTARFKFTFNATDPFVEVDRKATAPVPVLGVGISYYVNPRWTVSGFGEGLKVKVGDMDGWVVNASVSTDYMLTRHLGVGIGYNATSLRLDVAQSDFNGRITWTTQGVMAYGQLRF
jgi:hypothetical protein